MSEPNGRFIDGHVHMRGLNSIPNLAEVMDACGFDAMNIASLSLSGVDNVAQNCVNLLFKAVYPGRIYSFGGLRHPLSSEVPEPLSYEQQARNLIAMGCDGIKLLEGKTSHRKALGEPLDADVYDGLYGYLAAAGIPVLFHVGDPATFWDPARATDRLKELGWYYGDGTYPSLEQLRTETRNVLDRFPGLRVVFAHFYFMSGEQERLGEMLDRYPSMCIDVTPGGEMYHDFSADRAGSREFFTRYADRILFGTDNAGGRRTPNPERTAGALAKVTGMRTFFETSEAVTCFGGELHGLELDPDVIRKLYSGNFVRWAGEAPKPADVGLAYAECLRLMELAGDDPGMLCELPAVAEQLKQLT